jgi:hypothetical protein
VSGGGCRWFELEQAASVFTAILAQRCNGTTEQIGDECGNHWQQARFVAPALGYGQLLFVQMAGQQVRGVCLQQQAILRHIADGVAQRLSAPGVAYPPGYADVETEVEVSPKLAFAAGKAMGHTTVKQLAVVIQNIDLCFKCVTFMQIDWFFAGDGNIELPNKRLSLVRWAGKISVVIETHFADCKHLGRFHQEQQLLLGGIVEVIRIMGVYARSGKHVVWIPARQTDAFC